MTHNNNNNPNPPAPAPAVADNNIKMERNGSGSGSSNGGSGSNRNNSSGDTFDQFLRVGVTALCQAIGFQSVQGSSLDILADIWRRQFLQLGKLTTNYAIHYGRTQATFDDTALALRDLGINVSEIEEYIQNFDPVPLPFKIPSTFPIPTESHLNFLRPGSEEVLTRPVHVHEYMPPWNPPAIEDTTTTVNNVDRDSTTTRRKQQDTPNSRKSSISTSDTENELGKTKNAVADHNEKIKVTPEKSLVAVNGIKEDSQSNSNSNQQITAESPSSTPPRPSTTSAVALTNNSANTTPVSTSKANKRWESPNESPALKRVRMMIEEEGYKVREIKSVMMTTSGFLTSSVEGRLPDTRPPPNLSFFEPAPVEKKKKIPTMKQIVEGIKKIDKEKENKVQVIVNDEDKEELFDDQLFSNPDKIQTKSVPPIPIPVEPVEHIEVEQPITTNKKNLSPPEKRKKEKSKSPSVTRKYKSFEKIAKESLMKKEERKRAKQAKLNAQTTTQNELDMLIPEISINVTKQAKPPPPPPEFNMMLGRLPMQPGLIPTNFVPPSNLRQQPSSSSSSQFNVPPSISITPSTPDISLTPLTPQDLAAGTSTSLGLPTSVGSAITITRINMGDSSTQQQKASTPSSSNISLNTSMSISITREPSKNNSQSLPFQHDSNSGITITPIVMNKHAGSSEVKSTYPERPEAVSIKKDKSPVAQIKKEAEIDEDTRTKEQRRKDREKRKELKKEKKKEKKLKEREKEKKSKSGAAEVIISEKKEKKDKKKKLKDASISSTASLGTIPKITLKLHSSNTSTPVASPGVERHETPPPVAPRKITIKPIEEIVRKRTPSPELARFSPLITRPSKQSKSATIKAPNVSLSKLPPPSEVICFPPVGPASTSSGEKVKKSRKGGRTKSKSASQASGLITETVGFYIDEMGNKVWICPACGRQDDGTPMIGCDTCDDWYHFLCVGIVDTPDESESWYCGRCIVKSTQSSKPRKNPKQKV